MKTLSQVFFIVFLVSFGAAAGQSLKKTPMSVKNTARLKIPSELNRKESSLPLDKILPMDMTVGSSENQFMGRVADRGISYWFNNSSLKDSSLLQAAKAASETLNAEVASQPDAESGVQHKFKMKLEAFQSLAKLEYEGWVNAVLNHDLRASVTEVRMKDADQKDFILCHRAKENLSTIGLAWSF